MKPKLSATHRLVKQPPSPAYPLPRKKKKKKFYCVNVLPILFNFAVMLISVIYNFVRAAYNVGHGISVASLAVLTPFISSNTVEEFIASEG